jgi:hypothetical protein
MGVSDTPNGLDVELDLPWVELVQLEYCEIRLDVIGLVLTLQRHAGVGGWMSVAPATTVR